MIGMVCGRATIGVDAKGENCTSEFITDVPAVLGGSCVPVPEVAGRIPGSVIGAAGGGRYRRVVDTAGISEFGQEVYDRLLQRSPPALPACSG